MKTVNLCDFGDILIYSKELGYSWNEAHEYLVNADIYEDIVYVKDVVADGVFFDKNEHVEARMIISGFAKKHNVEEFYIAPKGW